MQLSKSNIYLVFSLTLVFILIFSCFSYCFAEESVYVWSSSANTVNENINNITNKTNENVTTAINSSNQNTNNVNTNSSNMNNTNITNKNTSNNVTNTNINSESSQNNIETNAENVTDDNSLNLESASAILIEQTTGKVLYAHNIHEQLRPASVTKVMSILLIMEAINQGKISLSDEVPCSENAASMGGSQIWLDTKETLTVDEMLKAICVNSANDCVVAMAEYIAGSEEAFVQMMNDKAKELGMSDTCFKNCHGLDEDGHVSSSYDISVMSRELLNKYPDVTKYTTIWMDTLRDGKTQLSNTNKLIKNYAGATGLKTGSTSLALYNLSASATRDNLSLIAVVMKAPSTKVRFAEAEKLLNYGFNTFSFEKFGEKGDMVSTVNINKGVKTTIPAILEETAGILLAKGNNKNVEQLITMDENISAPITKGQKLGEVKFVLDGETLATVNVVANEEVDKIDVLSMTKKVYKDWFCLLR